MPEFYKEKLKNGLTILFEKRSQPVVSISVSVKEGSAYESIENKGISHFIEHLAFKGTKTRSYKEIAEEIEKKGGVLNAYTGEEVTCFWNKLPSKHFATGIEIASDLILNPKFDNLEFEKEKKVIFEEIKMYHDTPQFYVLDKIKELLYKKQFGMSGLGNYKTISKLTRDNIANYFNSNYSTDKMILCVVGNTKLEDIEECGKKFPYKKGKINEVSPIKINKSLIEKRKGLEQAHFAVGFHISNAPFIKKYCHEIFNVILAGGMSSRLFEEIREKRGLAYDIRGMIEHGKNYGYNVIYIGTTKNNAKLCKEIVFKEIEKMGNLEAKDLEQAKEQLIGLRKVGSEESINVMNALINEEIMGKAEEFYEYETKISKVKLEEVKAVSKQKSYSSVMLVPG